MADRWRPRLALSAEALAVFVAAVPSAVDSMGVGLAEVVSMAADLEAVGFMVAAVGTDRIESSC